MFNMRNFIFDNLKPYDGDESFLVGSTARTKKLWQKCLKLLQDERQAGGVLDVDTATISTIVSHKPGYIDKKLELIVGLQTDSPLKRAVKPFGGIRTVIKACDEQGKEIAPEITEIFTKYRKSHSDAVFDAYTDEMRKLRKTGVLTGLPDSYARGRIIGDYRRVALYGVNALIEEKENNKRNLTNEMVEETIRLREEISDQIEALEQMKTMAMSYGYDISRPAKNATEAIQWTYFAFLAAIKEQDGAAMSLGSVSGFFDIYIEKDTQSGKLNEEQAQELIDQFVIKLRLVRQLRTKDYDEIFAGDPTWLTEAIGGVWQNGQHKVTKTAYRFLQTLYNLGPSPEPNMTILWSNNLPENFKKFCARVSIETSSIQYENDDLMRSTCSGDDYGISCCVSRLNSGDQIQYFGARCNMAKTLLLAVNGGVDEETGIKVFDGIKPLKDGVLKYDDVIPLFNKTRSLLAKAYVDTMNVIHYMHDKYYYEKAQMALLDTKVNRLMAFGMAGLSVTVDSLSALKYAKVIAKRDKNGLTSGFEITGDFPKYGNDDDRADTIAKELVDDFMAELSKHHIYRQARPTLSILTITSNVMYGKKTGATPDGRKVHEPFAPGANPMHGRDTHGAIASLNSVAKLHYSNSQDGISNTFSITPKTLGNKLPEQIDNLVSLLSGYFSQGAHHLNVNVLNRNTLLDAMEHPENYPQLTIRVSGYAVNFINLSRAHQQEVLARTFFESM